MFDARADVRGFRDGGHRQHERRLRRVLGARGDAHGVENRGGAREAREPLEGRGAVLRGDRDVAVPRRARRAAEPERSLSAAAAPFAAAAVAAEPAAAAEVAAAEQFLKIRKPNLTLLIEGVGPISGPIWKNIELRSFSIFVNNIEQFETY